MQWRPGAAVLTNKSGRRQRGIIPQQSLDRRDVTYANRQSQVDRDLVVARDPLAGPLLSHVAHHARRREMKRRLVWHGRGLPQWR
jgi:hypothetical protein